jgi:hypothetical protein
MTTPNEENTGGHPALDSLLEGIPQEFIPVLRPRLEEMDRNAQQKIQSVQSEFEEWQQFVDNGIDPQTAYNALVFGQELSEDPKGMLKRIAEHFNVSVEDLLESGQGQTGQANGEDPDSYENLEIEGIENHPTIKRLLADSEKWSEYQQQQQQSEADAEAMDTLDEYLEELHEEYGDFDEQVVLAYMGAGVTGEDAVEMFQDLGEKYFNGQAESQEQQSTVPIIAGSGGNVGTGLPDPTNRPKSLSRQDVNSVVVEILKKANEQ